MSGQQEGEWFCEYGSDIIGARSTSFRTMTSKRKWKAHFGISLRACLRVWLDIRSSHPNLRREHLLMGLSFLQCYRPEEVACPVFKLGAKNYRKWVWFVVDRIAKLEYVCAEYAGLVQQ